MFRYVQGFAMLEYLKEHDSKHIYGSGNDVLIYVMWVYLITPHDSPRNGKCRFASRFFEHFVVKVPRPICLHFEQLWYYF